MANFRRIKDHFTFLNAIHYLKINKNLSVNFYLIGQHIDEVYLDEVKQKIKSLQLGNLCKYIGPSLNIEEFLNKAFIGVLSSKAEGLPISLLEYGASGLFPICTKVGACPDVISKFGLLYEVGDYQKLAEHIFYCFQNGNEVISKSKSFKNRVDKVYGSKNFIINYFKLISNLN